MAQKTALSVNGTPGRKQTFVAKDEAVIPKGAGPFTELSAMATPGRRHSFAAKTEAEVVEGGTRRTRHIVPIIRKNRKIAKRRC